MDDGDIRLTTFHKCIMFSQLKFQFISYFHKDSWYKYLFEDGGVWCPIVITAHCTPGPCPGITLGIKTLIIAPCYLLIAGPRLAHCHRNTRHGSH